MGRIDARLEELGIALPAPTRLPEGVRLPFVFVNLRGGRAAISGHPRQAADGALDGPFGQVGADLDLATAQAAARGVGLSVLANLRAALGDLDRVTGWVRVFGMVNSAPGFSDQHLVLNGFSDLILDVFGPDVGRHARSAIGVAGLPMNFAMEIEGEVEIAP